MVGNAHDQFHVVLNQQHGGVVFVAQDADQGLEVFGFLGEQARFHTCSAEGMTAGELVAFLAAKGKFIPSKDGFSTDQSKICRH